MNLTTIFFMAGTIAIPLVANATTLTFDDLPTSPPFGQGTVPTIYDGLNLTCEGGPCQVVNSSTYAYNPSGYQGATISGTNVLSTASDAAPDTLTIAQAGGGTFVFNNAYLTGAWRNGLNISAVGMNGTTQIDSESFTLGNAGTPTLATFNWSGVTSVTITASGGTSGSFANQTYELAVDNLTYDAAPVPLPASVWLMVSSLGGLGVLTRRRSTRIHKEISG